jgi:hypothetical protein
MQIAFSVTCAFFYVLAFIIKDSSKILQNSLSSHDGTQKKNIKTELQGTYFYSQTPSSSLVNVYCEGSNVQDKFAGQRKTKSTYALELLGLQRFIPKHLHQ